jgi:3,4-dihydroxy 2-butanone 4-phosphate synthase/GTP cyclohydrolase II
VTRVGEARLPTEWGTFTAVAYRTADGNEHLALIAGELATGLGDLDTPLVRVHSECLTGDVLGSRRCDCGEQLHAALAAVQRAGHGVVVYLRGHEGRGIGLAAKIQAYALQDDGLDTYEANVQLGYPEDGRDFADAAAILADLGVRKVRLMSNNPLKLSELDAHGIEVVERVPVEATPTTENLRYLRSKRDRMGHTLDV